jgi:hypothetical protein
VSGIYCQDCTVRILSGERASDEDKLSGYYQERKRGSDEDNRTLRILSGGEREREREMMMIGNILDVEKYK